MSHISAIRERSERRSPLLTFTDQNNKGKLKFKDGDRRLLGVGVLTALAAAAQCGTDARRAPEYLPDPQHDETVLCLNVEGDLQWEFVGRLWEFTGQGVPLVPIQFLLANDVANAADPANKTADAELTVSPPESNDDLQSEPSLVATDVQMPRCTVPQPHESSAVSSVDEPGAALTKQRSRGVKPANPLAEWYVRELERIRHERAAGLDSTVRIQFLVIYLGECRANLYRKMKMVPAQLPLPIKRGRGSFWTMSSIDAYAAGKLGV